MASDWLTVIHEIVMQVKRIGSNDFFHGHNMTFQPELEDSTATPAQALADQKTPELRQTGVENVSDHGTIGPRNFWGDPRKHSGFSCRGRKC